MKILNSTCVLVAAAMSSIGQSVILYDSASNVRPEDASWGWTLGQSTAGTYATGPGGAGYTTLASGPSNAVSVGWAKSSPLILDPMVGYTASWKVQLVSESHASDNLRAGLSFFALGSDKKGVEIGFWQDRVFAYNDNQAFSPAEFFALDTTAAMHTYSLTVTGPKYNLFIDGTKRLSGDTRNYAAVRAQYNVANALWYGDDTSRAQSVSRWSSMEVKAVPEPASICALGLGLAAVLRRKRG